MFCKRGQHCYLQCGLQAEMSANRRMGRSNISHHLGGVLIHCYSASDQGTNLGLDVIQLISSLLPRSLISEQMKKKLSELPSQCAFVLYLPEMCVAGIVWRAENATSRTVRSLCFSAFSSPVPQARLRGGWWKRH